MLEVEPSKLLQIEKILTSKLFQFFNTTEPSHLILFIQLADYQV